MKRSSAFLSLLALLANAGCPDKAAVPRPADVPRPPALGEELTASFDFAPIPSTFGYPYPFSPLEVPVHPVDKPRRPWDCESDVGESLAAAGDRLLKADKPGEAVTCFKEALASDQAIPDEDKVRFNLGKSYALAGLTSNADEVFRALSQGDGFFAQQAQSIVAIVDRMTARNKEEIQRNRDEIRRLDNALKRLLEATGRPPGQKP